MANPSQDKNSYIPPHIEQAMTAHLDQSMPANLKKYQNMGAAMPGHAENAITQHMQESLPNHMKQYAKPYMHQNVVLGGGGASPPPSSPGPTRSPSSFIGPPRDRQQIRNDNKVTQQDPYGFILDPKPPQQSPLIGGPNSTAKRTIIVVAGFISLIIIAVVAINFMNSGSNAQKQRMLEVAQTQTEIVRIAEASSRKASDDRIARLAALTQTTTRSSLNDTLSALTSRGVSKVSSKDLSKGKNPLNDQALTDGEANSNFDQTYLTLLKQQLDNYLIQLQAAQPGGNAAEQEAVMTALAQASALKSQLESIQ